MMKGNLLLNNLKTIILIFRCFKERINKNMGKFIFVVICYMFCLQSCENTEVYNSKSIQSKLKIEEIKKYLEYQKRVESEEKEFENPYMLSEKDLFLAMSLENESLIKNGFKSLEKSAFEEKILKIFNIKINSTNCPKVKITDSLITYFGSDLDGTKETLNQNEFELQSITNNLFFSRSNNFFTHMYLLKELAIIEDGNYKLIVPQKVISRNKYLLNDDKSLFSWLTINDGIFMKSLLTEFGYTNDKELLSWIIKNNHFEQTSKNNTNGIEFGHVLYSRNCSSGFKVHKEIFDVMEAEMSLENTTYLDNLLEYVTYLSNIENDPLLTFAERSNIIAHILYFGQDLANNKGYAAYKFKCMGFFHEHLDADNRIAEEFRKNNYYGFPNFKTMWDEAVIEGDGVAMPGEE